MPSQNKLIKNGIKYTDALFDEISKRLEKGVRASDTLEDFLVKYNEVFPDKGNPVISLGYDAKMLDLILKETNNHKFSRPAQKELVRVTIENQVGDLIVDVGEDIRQSVRDIVQEGYNNNLSQDEIAENISNRVSVIKNKRARAIARTEIARTATISDYVINAERGATHFYVECRNTACPICKEAWHNNWSKANDESFKPNDSSSGGKGWIGDKTYSMNDVGMLPPIHPNCRCVAYFVSEEEIPKGNVIVEEPTTITTKQDTGTIENQESMADYIISTKEAYSQIGEFYEQYGDAPEEHGYIMDIKTGEKYSPTFHGEGSEVVIPESSENGASYVKTENCSFIHNHPKGVYRAFSPNDINVTFRSEKINHCIAVSEKEVWILKTNPSKEEVPVPVIVRDFNKASQRVQFEHADFKFNEEIKLKKEYKEPELSKKLKEFDEYLKSEEYLDMINERMADEYSKVAKVWEQYISFERITVNELHSRRR